MRAGHVLRRTLLTAAGCALAACATKAPPSTQTVWVDTPGCPGAGCELRNDLGAWQVAHTPGSVTLTPSAAALETVCTTADAVRGSAAALSTKAQPSAAGAVVGGAVGAGAVVGAVGAPVLAFIPAVGALVVVGAAAAGAVSGRSIADASVRTWRYPDRFAVPMNCAEPAALAARPGGFGFAVRGWLPGEPRPAGAAANAAVQVAAVVEGSAAATAGLRAGDLVLQAAGQPLNEASELERMVQETPPGGRLVLSVWRLGQVHELVLERPEKPR